MVITGGGGTDVVRVGTTVGQQRAMSRAFRLNEVVLELPPLVPRDIGIDQVVSLEEKPDPSPGEALVAEFLHRGRDAQRQRPGRLQHAGGLGGIEAGRTPGHAIDRTSVAPDRVAAEAIDPLLAMLDPGRPKAAGCRIKPYLDQERHRCAAPLARRQRRAQPWEARPAHAGPHRAGSRRSRPLTRHADRCSAQPSSSARNCPARGHRVNGGPPGRRTRSAFADH